MEPATFSNRDLTGEIVVHQYAQSERGFVGNSYLIETAEAVISIDTPMHRADGEALNEYLHSLKKPLEAVFYTHPHPDHYLWTSLLIGDRDIPVYATPQLTQTFPEVDQANRERWKPIYGDAYPDKTIFPTATIADGETITVGGIDITAHHMGDGEGPSMVMYTLDEVKAAFPNDILFTRTHPFLGEGNTNGWLNQLVKCREIIDEKYVLFPGHGDPAGILALDFQSAYLVAYREAVRALTDGTGRLSDAAIQRLKDRMERIIPNGEMEEWVLPGAKPVAAELSNQQLASDAGAAELREFIEDQTLGIDD